MGLEDLVGKFFDGVKKNTTDRYLKEARERKEKEESSPEYQKKLKKEKAQAIKRRRESKKQEQYEKKEKTLITQCQGLTGEELEKQIEKVIKSYLIYNPKAGPMWIKRLRKKCIEESKIEKISKDEALKKMKELKEFLDLTVISQEEFDKKSKRLKEIILGE